MPALEGQALSFRPGLKEPLSCRLLARESEARDRSPGAAFEVAEKRRRKLGQQAKERDQTSSRKELALCDWTVYVTNALVALLSLSEAFVMARQRWQIKLVFRLWKSQRLVGEGRSQKPWRILCELYARLLGALTQHGILVVMGRPDSPFR